MKGTYKDNSSMGVIPVPSSSVENVKLIDKGKAVKTILCDDSERLQTACKETSVPVPPKEDKKFCPLSMTLNHLCDEHCYIITYKEFDRMTDLERDYHSTPLEKRRRPGSRVGDDPELSRSFNALIDELANPAPEVQPVIKPSILTPDLSRNGTPKKERPGVRCKRCQKRGHMAADCTESKSKHGVDLVQAALSEETQRQLGIKDSKIEKIEEQLAKAKEKLDKAKSDKDKVDHALSRIQVPIEIRAPSGLIVEGFNIHKDHETKFIELVRRHGLRLKHLTEWVLIYTFFMLCFVVSTLFLPHEPYVNYNNCTWTQLGQEIILISIRPSHIVTRIFLNYITMVLPWEMVEWINLLFKLENIYDTTIAIVFSGMMIFYTLLEYRKVAHYFFRIRMEFLKRDSTDYKKMMITPMVKWLTDHKYIRFANPAFKHWIYLYIDELAFLDIKNTLVTLWWLIKLSYSMPAYLFVIWPLHIYSYTQTLWIDTIMLDDREYLHYEDWNDDAPNEISLIKEFNLVRNLKITSPKNPFVEFDARADLSALSELKHIDPMYSLADMSYEFPKSIRINMKNQYKRNISLELFMQLTTPHIVNLLDREEDVKFRLNRSSVNFHGVNVDKFQHLCGEDVVNTTLDCVYHYYRSRKWAFSQACPEELFYIPPVC